MVPGQPSGTIRLRIRECVKGALAWFLSRKSLTRFHKTLRRGFCLFRVDFGDIPRKSKSDLKAVSKLSRLVSSEYWKFRARPNIHLSRILTQKRNCGCRDAAIDLTTSNNYCKTALYLKTPKICRKLETSLEVAPTTFAQRTRQSISSCR